MNNTSDKPIVTIAIPNYNTGTYIGEAIESALSQTVHDIEILIVDNASTDNSRDIIRGWVQEAPNINVRYYDIYVSHAQNWNRCLKHARGKYIVFLHADDRLMPNFLEASLEMFRLRPDMGYVLVENEIINNAGKKIGQNQFYEASGIIPGLSEARVNFIGWHTTPSQMLIRTECMRAIGGYHFSDVMAPILLNLRWDVGYLHTPLAQIRQHEQSATTLCIDDKTMIMGMYIPRMMALKYYLPPEAAHLTKLKEKIMEKTASDCLTLYGMNLLGRNEKRQCQEYMAMARGFWLDIDQTTIYRFLEEALKENDWTPQSLKEAWDRARPTTASSGPPYPLPEGAVIVPT